MTRMTEHKSIHPVHIFLFQEELDNTNFSFYYRTMEDVKAPFNDVNSTVAKRGLRLAALYNVDINYSAEQGGFTLSECDLLCTLNAFFHGGCPDCDTAKKF